MATRQDTLNAARDSWNAGDLDGYLELYDDRIRLHGYSPEPMDKARCAGSVRRSSPPSSPQLDFHEVLWDDAACTIRFTMTGHHVGEFMGVPATGNDIAVPGITILRFEGERVLERFSQADMLGLMVQLGAIPAPA